MNNKKIIIFWFRRDFRLDDNTGLFHALKNNMPVLPLFIFDDNIFHELPKKDKRVEFIYQNLLNIHKELKKSDSAILINKGDPLKVWREITDNYKIESVYANTDYEPYAVERDQKIKEFLNSKSISFHLYKDQVVFEKNEITKKDGDPYSVFTPYKNTWKKTFVDENPLTFYDTRELFKHFYHFENEHFPTLNEIGFEQTDATFPDKSIPEDVIKNYHQTRDYPYLDGTTRLGIHLRFGTVSIRECMEKGFHLNETWFDELIWREFYMMILHNYPQVIHNSFRKKYDPLPWINNSQEFDLWSRGQTGFPFVDAGMRELNETGFMHNRVRMAVASFLVKNLLIDWRWGERYFAEKLLDYELSSNNGNWQWAAGTGCDAAPYFRVFNPNTQMQKYDPDQCYVKKWVPEFGTPNYAKPMVDLKVTRQRAIETYKSVSSNK